MDVRLAEEIDEHEDEAPSEEHDESPTEAEEEPANEFNSGEMFCRFAPWQIDRMASALLGERPLCEKWISRDGKLAVLYPLRLSGRRATEKEFVIDMVEKWKTRFEKTAKS